MFSKFLHACDALTDFVVKVFIGVFFVGIICAVIYLWFNGEDCVKWCSDNEKFVKNAIEIISVCSSIFVAFASLGMMLANKKMVDAANRQISLMKSHHILAISPRIELPSDVLFSLGDVSIENPTDHVAYNVSVFARIQQENFFLDVGTLDKGEETEVSLKNKKGCLNLFRSKYFRQPMPPKWFKDFFYAYMKKNDVIFIVYMDAEGNIHGTAAQCALANDIIEIAPRSSGESPVGSQEDKVQDIMQARLRVRDQRFIIVEEDVPSESM